MSNERLGYLKPDHQFFKDCPGQDKFWANTTALRHHRIYKKAIARTLLIVEDAPQQVVDNQWVIEA